MDKLKIEAMTTFNDGVAYVLNKRPELIWKRLTPNVIYGTDGIFYNVLKWEPGSKQAFGGRKFTKVLDTGEVINCNGDYWDSGYSELERILEIKLVSGTAGSIQDLKECYVFTGYSADEEKLKELREEYAGVIYPIREYEKLIKYDDLWKKYIDQITLTSKLLGRSEKITTQILKNYQDHKDEQRRIRDAKLEAEMEEDYRDFI